MNKYLLLSAAALVSTAAATSSSSAASSGTITLLPHTPSGGSYCDPSTITWSGNNYAEVVNWAPCGEAHTTSYGMGIAGNTKGAISDKKKVKPNNVAISDNYYGDAAAGFEVDFQWGLPFKSGNAFNAYYTTNGSTVTEYIAGGTYTIVAPGVKLPKGLPSVRDALPKKVQN